MLERCRTLLGESETVRLDFSAGGNPLCANAARPCEVLSVEAGVSPANQNKSSRLAAASPCRRGDRIRPPQQAKNGEESKHFFFSQNTMKALTISRAPISRSSPARARRGAAARRSHRHGHIVDLRRAGAV